MPPSPDGKIIDDAVQDFVRGLHSDLPLRHFGEFHDQEELKKVVEQQKERVLRNVIAKVWTRDKDEIFSLLMRVINRINKEVIAEWRTKNGEHRVKALSFLQKRVDMICEDFNMALDDQFLLNPDMEIESLKNYVQKRKQVATSCFENIWKPGTAQMQEERKSKLEKQLQLLEEDIFEKRQRILESKSVDEGNKLLGEVRTILLERSRQMKCYVDKRQGQVARDTLRSMVEEMRDYILNGKGSALRESHEENFNKLVEVVEGEIKFWTEEPEGNMTAEHVVEYAERFDKKIRSCCFDNASDNVQEMQQDMNTRDADPTEDPRRRTTMQGTLNEFMEQQGGSLDLRENEAGGLTDESNVEGGYDSNSNGVAAPEPSSGRKSRIRQHPSHRRFKRSVGKTDSDDPTMIRGTTVPEVPPSKKERTVGDVARNTTRGSDVEIHRRSSSRQKKALASNSIPTPMAFPARRHVPCGKKISHDVDLTGRAMAGSGNPRASSEQAELRSVSKKSKGSKLGKLREVCRSDDKVSPNHITILEGEEPKYLCLVCKREFRWKKYLKYHGEFCGRIKSKSFICDECGKGFHEKWKLYIHTRVHTGEKPFRCPECPQRFSWKENLQRHIRCHAIENPYLCKPCNLTFVSAHSLHEHNLTHDGKFRLTCSYCDKRYDSMYKLRIHVINHADERPFKCPKCEAAFAKMDVLIPHIEQRHGQQRKVALNLAYNACLAYLLEETKDDSYRDISVNKISAAVVNHVIKKVNLRLPPDISAGDRST